MAEPDQINAMPTKKFFVDMFTRDIPLEQAVLDLVDNCIDGAKRLKAQSKKLDSYKLDIKFGKDEFSIKDNCGGFDRKTARDYAFRFGRPSNHEPGSHSIGQFGVGMKRALFKFGSHFAVRSATTKDEWAIDIDVTNWVTNDDWHFPWTNFKSNTISKNAPGTEVIVTKLRPEIAAKFGTENFNTLIVQLITSKHRQFISDGLKIVVNGKHLTAKSVLLLIKDSSLRPGVENIIFKDTGEKEVKARFIVGVGPSSPREAGWYVIGNGRVILESDRRSETGWGAIEDGSGKVSVPAFHNQFARFRGIVIFDSEDSSRIPWNTMKNDVDRDNPIWRKSLAQMIEMMRPVIDFLNDLDADIDEHGQAHSPMLVVVEKAQQVALQTLEKSASFKSPNKDMVAKSPKLVKIQYSRPTKSVEILKNALGLSSASAVGEKTFDLILARSKV